MQRGHNVDVHPLLARRTHVVLAVGCGVALPIGWVLGSLGAPMIAFYVAISAQTAIGTFFALGGRARFRRPSRRD